MHPDDLTTAPPYLAEQTLPIAAALDGDVLITVTVAAPLLPEGIGEIDVRLPLAFAKHLIVQLKQAVVEAHRQQG